MSRARPSCLALLVLVALGLGATRAAADAMLVSGERRLFPAAIAVDVTVHAQVESTTYRFDFGRVREPGRYTLTVPGPLDSEPIGVDIDRGAGWVALPVVLGAPPPAAGGDTDPAVSAWAGTSPLVAILDDVEAGPLTVKVRFVRLLRRVGGEVAFDVGVHRCPARADGYGYDGYGPPVALHLRLDTARDLAALDVSGGTSTTVERGTRRATVTSATSALLADEVVHVRYREAGSGIHAQLVTHRTPTADPLGGTAGYFLLLVDADEVTTGAPRTLSMVIDRSGSMAGAKLDQAREAARLMLTQLGPADRFDLHAFDDDIGSFADRPTDTTTATLTAARAWIDRIADDGSTNLDGGLAAGLTTANESGRFDAVILLSDGMATAGETDDREILRRATARAAERIRIYTVSIGTDADFALMEALARHNRGRHLALDDLQGPRDLSRRVRELVEDLRTVRLTDLQVSLEGVDAEPVMAATPPDLFAGGQLVIVGRYHTPGTATVRLTGRDGDAPFAATFALDAPALAPDDDILRPVWAAEQVRALMASIASGADPTVVRHQVEELGVAYRIQTPYTRYQGEVSVDTQGSGGCAAGGSDAGRGALAGLLLAAVLAGRGRRTRGAAR